MQMYGFPSQSQSEHHIFLLDLRQITELMSILPTPKLVSISLLL